MTDRQTYTRYWSMNWCTWSKNNKHSYSSCRFSLLAKSLNQPWIFSRWIREMFLYMFVYLTVSLSFCLSVSGCLSVNVCQFMPVYLSIICLFLSIYLHAVLALLIFSFSVPLEALSSSVFSPLSLSLCWPDQLDLRIKEMQSNVYK